MAGAVTRCRLFIDIYVYCNVGQLRVGVLLECKFKRPRLRSYFGFFYDCTASSSVLSHFPGKAEVIVPDRNETIEIAIHHCPIAR
jgi:hypothetical protein